MKGDSLLAAVLYTQPTCFYKKHFLNEKVILEGTADISKFIEYENTTSHSEKQVAVILHYKVS